ncbi:hypothetical protein [Gephyromycinifex aptenodytis]|uniref:hypothetical protein n=1 Tax=Gephyromycinifex aptenodytis TaxID=2716227 RepID=UPI0014484518|nr:hypothetical protein [Gephyromycinifex aptenodytis]
MPLITRVLAIVGAITLALVFACALFVAVIWWKAPTGPGAHVAGGPTVPGHSASANSAPGPLSGDDVWAHGLDLTADRVRTAKGDLLDVRVVAGGAGSTEQGVQGRKVGLDATVPFATVENQIGNGVKLRAAESNRVRASADIVVLGRHLPIEAVGVVTAEDGLLVVRPVQIHVDGSGFFDAVLGELARRTLTIRQPVPGLPQGMALESVQVQDGGFRVHIVGAEVLAAG